MKLLTIELLLKSTLLKNVSEKNERNTQPARFNLALLAVSCVCCVLRVAWCTVLQGIKIPPLPPPPSFLVSAGLWKRKEKEKGQNNM